MTAAVTGEPTVVELDPTPGLILPDVLLPSETPERWPANYPLMRLVIYKLGNQKIGVHLKVFRKRDGSAQSVYMPGNLGWLLGDAVIRRNVLEQATVLLRALDRNEREVRADWLLNNSVTLKIR